MANVFLAPVSVLLAKLLVQVADTVVAAKYVLIEHDRFAELAAYVSKMRPLLMELQVKNFKDAAPLRTALEALEREMERSQALIAECSSKNRFFLLVSCRSIVQQIEDITHQIGHCISLIPMASMNLCLETRESVTRLLHEMQRAQFTASSQQDEIIRKIERGIASHRVDSAFSNDLLLQIARAVGVSENPTDLRNELLGFKKQIEEMAVLKKQAEAFQLEQLMGILDKSDAATTTSEKQMVYQRKLNAGGSQQVAALQSFICPITQEVMEEPAEIASGQTFERSAILKWFSDGHRICPITKVELPSLEVKPNPALQSSVQEWRERNAAICIAGARPRLASDSHEEICSALEELHQVCEEKHLYKYWIASERLIPELVKLLEVSSRDIRKKVLEILGSLSVVDENKEEIAAAGALPAVVRLLSRDVGESRQAVALLVKLSESEDILGKLSSVQGCMLLLVTMLKSEDCVAVEDARKILMKLASTDDNVVQMAEVNYFQPVVAKLNKGSKTTKLLMANTLKSRNMTDESKVAVAREGAIDVLVKMLVSGKSEHDGSVLGALDNLSTVAENKEDMIAAGVLPPLFKLLFSISSTSMGFKEQAASTLANLASWNMKIESRAAESYMILVSEGVLGQILSLINLVGREVRNHLLKAVAALSSAKTTGSTVRDILRKCGAVQMLVELLEESSAPETETYICKLLCGLSGDGKGSLLASYLTPAVVEAFLKMITFSEDGEAKAAALGTLGSLPQGDPAVMSLLSEAGILPALTTLLLGTTQAGRSRKTIHKSIVENAIGALLLFTNPSSLDFQRQVASNGFIPYLVELLDSGTPLAKSRAAAALGQLSESTGGLTEPIPAPRGCWCFASPPEAGCEVHAGKCTLNTCFCLLKAGAVQPLIQMLSEDDKSVHEAALGALTTLLYDETWANGARVIANFQGVRPVVRLLTTGTPGTKEKAVWMLEKIFRIQSYKEEYGGAAQMALIDLAQQGSASTRQIAAKILAHLNILHNQSSYF